MTVEELYRINLKQFEIKHLGFYLMGDEIVICHSTPKIEYQKRITHSGFVTESGNTPEFIDEVLESERAYSFTGCVFYNHDGKYRGVEWNNPLEITSIENVELTDAQQLQLLILKLKYKDEFTKSN